MRIEDQRCLLCKSKDNPCDTLNELKTKYNKLVKYLNDLTEFEDSDYPFHCYDDVVNGMTVADYLPSEVLKSVGELK